MQNTSCQATDISLFNSYCHIKIIVVPQLGRLKNRIFIAIQFALSIFMHRKRARA